MSKVTAGDRSRPVGLQHTLLIDLYTARHLGVARPDRSSPKAVSCSALGQAPPQCQSGGGAAAPALQTEALNSEASQAKCLPGTTQLIPSPGVWAVVQGHGLAPEHPRAICNTFKRPGAAKTAGDAQACRMVARCRVTGQRPGPSRT